MFLLQWAKLQNAHVPIYISNCCHVILVRLVSLKLEWAVKSHLSLEGPGNLRRWYNWQVRSRKHYSLPLCIIYSATWVIKWSEMIRSSGSPFGSRLRDYCLKHSSDVATTHSISQPCLTADEFAVAEGCAYWLCTEAGNCIFCRLSILQFADTCVEESRQCRRSPPKYTKASSRFKLFHQLELLLTLPFTLFRKSCKNKSNSAQSIFCFHVYSSLSMLDKQNLLHPLAPLLDKLALTSWSKPGSLCERNVYAMCCSTNWISKWSQCICLQLLQGLQCQDSWHQGEHWGSVSENPLHLDFATCCRL